MTRIAVLAAILFAAPLFAQEEVYLYVRHKAAAGESVRYKLECRDAGCEVETGKGKRKVSLTTEQKKELLDALRADSRQFFIAADTPRADEQTKVKLRYGTPGKRLEIERRFPVGAPPDLTPETLQVIKTHFELDLSKPASPGADAEESPASPGTPSDAG